MSDCRCSFPKSVFQKRDRKLSETELVDACEEDDVEVVEYPTDVFHPELTTSMSPKNCSNCSSRRSSIKDEDLLFGHLTKRKGNKVDDIFDDGSLLHNSLLRFQPLNPVTQVYRAETSFPQQHQPHRQLYRDVLQQQLQRPTTLLPPPLEKSEIGQIPRQLSNRQSFYEDSESSPAESRRFDEDRLNKVTTPKGSQPPDNDQEPGRVKPRVETEKIRCRSRSENIPSSNFLDPLDISFEEDKSFEDKSDENWTPWKQNGHYLHSPDDENDNAHFDFNAGLASHNNNFVPSTDAVNTFLKSFDSATSMVFHGRTAKDCYS